jgi:O-antigen ligase
MSGVRPAAQTVGMGPTASLDAMERLLAVLIIATIFIAIFCAGSDRNDLALFAGSALSIEAALVAIIRVRNGLRLPLWPLAIPAALYIVVLGVALWSLTPYGPDGAHPIWSYIHAMPAITLDRSTVFVGLIKLGGLCAAFAAGLLYCSNPLNARFLLRTFVYTMTAYAAWALVMRSNAQFGLGYFSSFQGQRLSGSFQSANIAGTWFGMGFVLALCNFFERLRTPRQKAGDHMISVARDFIATLLIGTCLMLTVSRGAVAATLIASAVLITLELFAKDWRAASRQRFLVSILGVLTFIILAWSADLLIGRYATSVEDWGGQRQIIFETHWAAFTSSPWFGYGLGTFNEVNKLQETALNYSTLWNVRAAHNVYLQWLEQIGVVGAVPMFGCIGFLIALIFAASFRHRRLTSWLRGCTAVSILILIHGWSDFSLEIPALALTWAFLFGAGYGIGYRPEFNLHKKVSGSSNKPARLETRPTSPTILLAAGAAMLASISALAGVELDNSAMHASLPLPLSGAYGARADQLDSGLSTSPSNITLGQQLTHNELALSPASAIGWLRLAYLADRRGKPQPEISLLLDRSYTVAPLDPEIFEVRTRFAFETWPKLNADAKADVLENVRTGWRVWRQRDQLNALMPQIRNPTGRLALMLQIDGLRQGIGH